MDDRIAQPFHAGELRAQELAGGGPAGTGIRPWMPDQHRTFFGQLPFILASVDDVDGWPLATVLHGHPGFIQSPTPNSLTLDTHVAADDPAHGPLHAGASIGLLGIELPTRRRNRANGRIARLDTGHFEVEVFESFGNCPKYITARMPLDAARTPGTALRFDSALPAAAAAVVRAADTMFVATSGAAHGGSDVSHRGGPAGFVQVDGPVLTIPDYPGNRYFNTLGNMLVEPRCALLFIDFASGDILQLQGLAELLWKRPAPGDPMSVRSWRFHIVRGWLRPGAFPLAA